MYYVTGDVHGDQRLWLDFFDGFLKAGDTLLVAGDFGVGFFDGAAWPEEMFYDHVASKPYTLLFCCGNHENFHKLARYEATDWHGGLVHQIRANLMHLMRGEVFDLDGKKLFVMGGGYSLDKARRKEGESWWPEEMPSPLEYENAVKNLEKCGRRVDYILTHSAPIETVSYLTIRFPGIRCAPEEWELNNFLQWIQDTAEYEKWYFGHFHQDQVLWKGQYVLYHEVRELESGMVVADRRKK